MPARLEQAAAARSFDDFGEDDLDDFDLYEAIEELDDDDDAAGSEFAAVGEGTAEEQKTVDHKWTEFVETFEDQTAPIPIKGSTNIHFVIDNARKLHEDGTMCLRTRNLEQSYVLLKRFARTYFESLKDEPRFQSDDCKRGREWYRSAVEDAINNLEYIRDQIKERFRDQVYASRLKSKFDTVFSDVDFFERLFDDRSGPHSFAGANASTLLPRDDKSSHPTDGHFEVAPSDNYQVTSELSTDSNPDDPSVADVDSIVTSPDTTSLSRAMYPASRTTASTEKSNETLQRAMAKLNIPDSLYAGDRAPIADEVVGKQESDASNRSTAVAEQLYPKVGTKDTGGLYPAISGAQASSHHHEAYQPTKYVVPEEPADDEQELPPAYNEVASKSSVHPERTHTQVLQREHPNVEQQRQSAQRELEREREREREHDRDRDLELQRQEVERERRAEAEAKWRRQQDVKRQQEAIDKQRREQRFEEEARRRQVELERKRQVIERQRQREIELEQQKQAAEAQRLAEVQQRRQAMELQAERDSRRRLQLEREHKLERDRQRQLDEANAIAREKQEEVERRRRAEAAEHQRQIELEQRRRAVARQRQEELERARLQELERSRRAEQERQRQLEERERQAQLRRQEEDEAERKRLEDLERKRRAIAQQKEAAAAAAAENRRRREEELARAQKIRSRAHVRGVDEAPPAYGVAPALPRQVVKCGIPRNGKRYLHPKFIMEQKRSFYVKPQAQLQPTRSIGTFLDPGRCVRCARNSKPVMDITALQTIPTESEVNATEKFLRKVSQTIKPSELIYFNWPGLGRCDLLLIQDLLLIYKLRVLASEVRQEFRFFRGIFNGSLSMAPPRGSRPLAQPQIRQICYLLHQLPGNTVFARIKCPLRAHLKDSVEFNMEPRNFESLVDERFTDNFCMDFLIAHFNGAGQFLKRGYIFLPTAYQLCAEVGDMDTIGTIIRAAVHACFTAQRATGRFHLNGVLVPILRGMHWTLAVISFARGRLEYFDSLQNNFVASEIQDMLLTTVAQIRSLASGLPSVGSRVVFRSREWNDGYGQGTVRGQRVASSGSCGSIALRAAELIVNGNNLNESYATNRYCRLRQMAIIASYATPPPT